MGCIDSRPKGQTLQAREQKDTANAAPPHEQVVPPVIEPIIEQPEENLSPTINHNQVTQQVVNDPNEVENSGMAPSKIVKSRKKEIESYEEQINEQLNQQDINVSPSQNMMVMPGPASTIIKAKVQDYNPNPNEPGQVIPRQSAYIVEQQLVNSEKGVNFIPSIKNINFHVQVC